MKKKLIILTLLTMLVSGCSKKGYWKNLTLENRIEGYSSLNSSTPIEVDPFDTSMIIRYYFEGSEDENSVLEDKIVDLYSSNISHYHKIFDRHYYYYEDDKLVNNVKVINDSYGSGKEIIVDKDLFNLLKFAVSRYEITKGMFNIFTGSLTDYWEECFSAANNYEELNTFDPYFNSEAKTKLENIVSSIPNTKEEYESLLTFNEENCSVIFNKFDKAIVTPQISLGGVAKGYATDLIKNIFVKENLTNGVLYSGGSSLESLAIPVAKKGQVISIKDPNTFNDVAFSLTIKNEFNFSTSGNYTTNKSYRFVDNENNVIYRHHIINPFTGYPESYYRSVSLLSYSLNSAYLDILSTTLMNLNYNEGLAVREELIKLKLDLDIFYLIQEYNDSGYSLEVLATSNVDNTLEASKNIKVNYAK